MSAFHRHKHPELWELHLESRRVPDVLQRLLGPKSNAVDVGCHIGSFLSLLCKYAPAGRHIAFEASPTKSGWLRSRFPAVEVHARAVADVAGTAMFQEDTARPGFSRLGNVAGEGRNLMEVPVCRLDDVLADRADIALIKLDIEGAELSALRGARNVISRSRPAIIFECGSKYFLDDEKLSSRDLYDFITGQLGYRVFGMADFLYGKGAMEFDEFRKYGIYPFRGFNFVALPADAPDRGGAGAKDRA